MPNNGHNSTNRKNQISFDTPCNYRVLIEVFIPIQQTQLKNSNNMIRNFLKIGIRNLLKQRFYSIINITGLSVGIACCILIVMLVNFELSYDEYHEKSDRIYQVGFVGKLGENEFQGAQVGAPTGKVLKANYPEVEEFVRFREMGNFLMKIDDKSFREEHVLFTDSTIFEIFSFELLSGDPKTALKEPNTLVLDETTAKKYFGDEDPMGKTIFVDNSADYVVTGVMKDIPENSHFKSNVFLAMVSRNLGNDDVWLNMNFQTYILLAEGAKVEDLVAKFPKMIETYCGPELMRFMNITIPEFIAQGNKIGYVVEPVTDIYLKTQLGEQLGPVGDIKYVYIFSAIAFFILLIACINFMNLATARSANRAKEVGVRKSLGSQKRQLIAQFITESILISLIAVIIAVVLAAMALPAFNNLSGKNLIMPFDSPYFLPLLGLFAILIGIIAGSYPAFYLSAFNPARVLKGAMQSGKKGGALRSGLVVFQFAISIILVVGTLVIYNQLNYVQQKKMGYNKEQVLLIDDMWVLGRKTEAMKDEVKKLPGVKNATVAQFLPIPSNRSNTVFHPEGKATSDNSFLLQNWRVDYDYITTMGMEIVQGRDFSLDFPSDSSATILNERAIKDFGWEDDPIGKRVSRGHDNGEEITYTVIGVVKDFNYESLREDIGPLSLRLGYSAGYLAIRFDTKDIHEIINKVEDIWMDISGGQPFTYTFMDDEFNTTYESDQRVGNIAIVFATLAIFIACLGLFGLAAFTTEQRSTEIGVRKVLGASVSSIVMLLSKEFGKLVLIAVIISTPVAWYVMDGWLSEFAYRIELSVWVFIIAGLLALIVAWVTMGYQCIKAAIANPVDAIKRE